MATFAGKRAKVYIEIDAELEADVGYLTVDIKFAADSLVFEMNGVVVSPLTCTASDEQWSLQVPAVKT